ncbi:MAG: enoyl-CoA hydratase-related protein [Candidatus Cyclobacteriaceae bacterium M3_2C_046]
MQQFETIEIEQKERIFTIWLNRPEIRNAFNEIMILELIEAFGQLKQQEQVRVIVLRGRGKSFCAGADLNWMRNVVNYSDQQNLQESLNLSRCFYEIYSCPKPTIAMVHGAAIGGANGLLAACDIALAEENTIFSLSEVKIGIVPACISPYLVKRVGEFPSRELMLTGRRIKGHEAEKYGLINHALPESDLERFLNELTDQLLTSGPVAITQCKHLLDQVNNHWDLKEAGAKTAAMIAQIRASAEGQEGMAAFLEKRKPGWIENG